MQPREPASFGYVCNTFSNDRFDRIRKYVAEHDLPPILETFCDPITATAAPWRNRVGLNRLRFKSQQGDCLIVTDLQDLGVRHRGLVDLITVLWRRGLTIHAIEQSLVAKPGGDIDETIETICNVWEKWHQERTVIGQRVARQKGQHIGRNAPFGRQPIRENGKVVRRMGCWWERRWLKFIEDGMSEGKTLRAIHAEMKKRKAKTNDGRLWSYDRIGRYARQIRASAQSPILKGERT